jgi:hypothetical protein
MFNALFSWSYSTVRGTQRDSDTRVSAIVGSLCYLFNKCLFSGINIRLN